MKKVNLDNGKEGVLIELKDLRIGNYLRYKDDFVYVTCLSLDIDDEYEDSIYFCKVGEHSDEKGGWNRTLCADLAPIKIFQKLLEKITWKIPLIYLVWNGKYASIQANQYIMDEENEVVACEYVHELQNAYFLFSGEELVLDFHNL